MYTQFFNLQAPPFSIAPNPRYLYMSQQHREALAHLLYGINEEGGGFVALTGEVGTGKTTLCRCLLEQLPDSVDVALIFNPRLNAAELLASICDELHVEYPPHCHSLKILSDALNKHLLAAHAGGRRTVVLIDEAQNLSFEVLEQVRLLTNLETSQNKLLQVILVGQPELKRLLQQANLRQLAQRITARYHLQPLSFAETRAYIRHRLAVSGCRLPLFTRSAMARIHWLSGGIPRLINVICDRALLGAYSLGKTRVGVATVRHAAREVLAQNRLLTFLPKAAFLALGASALLVGVALYRHGSWDGSVIAALPRHDTLAGGMASTHDPVQPRKRALAAAPVAETVATGPGDSAQPARPSGALAEAAAPPADKPVAETGPSAAAGPSEVAQPSGALAAPSPLQAAVTAPAQAADAPSFTTLLTTQGVSKAAVLASLLERWGLQGIPAGAEPCVFARAQGLSCLSQQSTWAELRKLNHPAVLEFVLPDGQQRFAALVGTAGSDIELEIGGQVHTFDPIEVLSWWRGQSTLLWKPPVPGVTVLRPGQYSPAVPWLRQRLDPAGDAERATPNLALFDAGLAMRVKEFQGAQGLLQDSVAGPQTFICLLKQMAAPGIPWLAAKAE